MPTCEILAFFLFAPALLGVTRIKAAVVGAVLGAIGMDAAYKKAAGKAGMKDRREKNYGDPQCNIK